MSLIFLFIDGVGLGCRPDPENNPFCMHRYPAFEEAAGGQPFLRRNVSIREDEHLFKSVDARLSVEGLPQSGTGQTTLFSGHNAAAELGRHFGPYPHSAIRHLLNEESLFYMLQESGKSCYFMNAYPDLFFERAKKRNRWSCTTLMALNAQMRLNTLQDVLSGDAITAEILQDAWKRILNLDVPDITAEEAALRVLTKADEFDLVLTEFYLTDIAGHGKDFQLAHESLQRFNDFLYVLLREKKEHTILLTSDHGNIEDLSTRSHTMNDVPLLVRGPGAGKFDKVQSLTDIKAACLKWFNGEVNGCN